MKAYDNPFPFKLNEFYGTKTPISLGLRNLMNKIGVSSGGLEKMEKKWKNNEITELLARWTSKALQKKEGTHVLS